MTQQKLLPTEEQVPVEDRKLAANRVLQVAAILFGGHIVATFFLFFFAVQLGSWQIYTMAGVLTLSNAIYFAALRMLRKSRLETAGWMLITAMLVDIIAGPLLISGSGIVLGFIFVTAAYLIANQMLQAKYTRQILAVSIAVGILLALTDFLNLDYRLQVPALQSFTPIIAAVVLLPAAFIIIREAWFRSLTVSRKLFIVFSILFVFALTIAALGLFGLSRVQNAYENTLTGGVEIQNRADNLNNALLKARRREKDFLLQWKEEGFNSAYTSYVAPYNDHIVTMKITLDELGALAPVLGRVQLRGYSQEQYTSDIASINEDVLVYEQAFTQAVYLIEERGFDDTGLEGDFRTAGSTIEALVYDREGLDPLVITMLQVRRREQDYLLRGHQQYVDNVHDLVAELKNQAGTSDGLTSAEKQEIESLADEYLVKFDAVVEKDKELAASIEVFRAAAAKIQTATDRLAGVGKDLAVLDVRTAQANSTQTFIISIITVIGVLIASIVLAIILSREITRPVVQLTNTATEIAAGKFDVVAEISSGDEIGTLAKTFNIMTERLGAAFEDVRRRALAVQTSAEVSRRLSTTTNPRQLAVEVVEQVQSAFHYYHAHIYFLDEETGDLIMAGGTGEAGATMLASGHKISKGRGLVGRAAETNAPVLVPDVSQSIGWLPNPLLPDTKSETAIPISSGKQVLGVLDVQQNVVNGLSEEDVELLQSLAGQVAISLQNARTLDESRAKAELESLVNTIGQKIQRAATVEDTLQTAIREVGLALGASRVSANITSRQAGDNNGSQN